MKEVRIDIKNVKVKCPDCDNTNVIKGGSFVFTGRSHEPFIATHTCTSCAEKFKACLVEGF